MTEALAVPLVGLDPDGAYVVRLAAVIGGFTGGRHCEAILAYDEEAG